VSAPTYSLGKLHGGLRLDAHKSASTAKSIVEAPVPAQLTLSLIQNVGEPAVPLVTVGDRVLRGQLIASAGGDLGVPVHASSSGIVAAIESRPVASRHVEEASCIVIDCDGRDEAFPGIVATDFTALQPTKLLSRILEGGIVGLGGAVFPTAQKLMQARSVDVDLLILNGVECEPYISCDDVLMRERADAVLVGAQILMHALQADACCIAVESDKPEAVQRLSRALAALDDPRIALRLVPTVYPSGGEDQLVQLLTNREVPSSGLPTDVGCVVQNVGTAAAVYDWIAAGEPLISRVTTVTGDGVAEPVNVRARVGTPVADLVQCAGGYTERARHLVIGGPMTGKSIGADDVPLPKSGNCVLVVSGAAQPAEELPCIRCGDCAAVCPVQLLPQQLLAYSRNVEEAQLREFGLLDCIECGCCDLVCPSHIPLTAGFRRSKARLRELADEQARAERARRRFEARNQRLEREQRERDAELAQQKASARAAGPEAIAAILERKQRQAGDD
jgi:electron transport complex protein RnfC